MATRVSTRKRKPSVLLADSCVLMGNAEDDICDLVEQSALDCFGLNNSQYWKVEQMYHDWQICCNDTFKKQVICPVCSRTVLGNSISQWSAMTEDTLQRYLDDSWGVMTTDAKIYIAKARNGRIYVCQYCYRQLSRGETRQIDNYQASRFTPHYLEQYFKCLNPQAIDPIYRYYLGFLDVSFDFYRRSSSNLLTSSVHCLFEMPLIIKRPDGTSKQVKIDIPPPIMQLLETNLQENPLYRTYLPLLNVPNYQDITILDPEVITNIIEQSANRDPRQRPPDDPSSSEEVNAQVKVILRVNTDRPYGLTSDKKFQVGFLHKIANQETGAPSMRLGNTIQMLCRIEGVSVPVLGVNDITIESALFPYLFPSGKGFYTDIQPFSKYIRMRMQQLYSPFTLTQEYICMMFQIFTMLQYATNNNKYIVERDWKKYFEAHPLASEEQAIENIIKHMLPKTTPHSPLWFQNKLYDMEAMTSKFGLPFLFMTLTVDDVSSTKWQEYIDLEAILSKIHPSFTPANAPVEQATLFHHRFSNFFDRYILGNDTDIHLLGKVDHYVVRYEMQHRQALHAHTCLWINEADRARVMSELSQWIPADIDEETGEFIEPTDPLQKRLFHIIQTKNQHNCNNGCRVNGTCKYGFPFLQNTCRTPKLDYEHNRYLYYCPRYADRNTVAYHPLVSLLWNAHANVLLVTSSDLSHYLLKYTMKIEDTGTININTDLSQMLGLQGIPDSLAKTVAALTTSKPISCQEAALQLLDIPIIQMSDEVVYKSTQPPGNRTKDVNRLSRSQQSFKLNDIGIYENRPKTAFFENIKFIDYFEQYEIRKEKLNRNSKELVARDAFNNYIYKRDQAIVVRTTRSHPASDDPEGFFFNILLSFILSYILILTKYPQLLCRRRRLTDTHAKLTECINDYLSCHFSRDTDVDEIIESIQNHYTDQLINGNFQKLELEYSIPNLADFDLVANDEQAHIIQKIQQNSNQIHIVNGCPGTGKSFIISFLHRQFFQQNKNVILCASTGAAAAKLPGGMTVDRVVGLSRHNDNSTTIFSQNKAFPLNKGGDVYIIDEAFMLSRPKFDQILLRMFSCTQDRNWEFEDFIQQKLIILVGDRDQLQPICFCRNKTEAGSCKDCSLEGSTFIQNYCPTANRHTLHRSMRHSEDPEFAAFVQSIPAGFPDEKTIYNLFGDLVLRSQSEWFAFMAQPDAISVHGTNADAIEFSSKALSLKFDQKHIFKCDALVNIDDFSLLDKLQVQKLAKSATPPTVETLAIGCKVIITSTTNFNRGIINGTSATVTKVGYRNADGHIIYSTIPDPEDTPAGLEVFLSSARKYVKIHRLSLNRPTQFGVQMKIKYFPIVLGYSITSHKSQGATITGPILIDTRQIFAPGMLYVMLTRARKRSQIRFTTLPTSNQFVVFSTDPGIQSIPNTT